MYMYIIFESTTKIQPCQQQPCINCRSILVHCNNQRYEFPNSGPSNYDTVVSATPV